VAKGIRTFIFFAVLLVLATLISCQGNIISVGPSSKVFSASQPAERLASPSSGGVLPDPDKTETMPAPLAPADKYGKFIAPVDKLANFAKSLLEKSGSSVVFVNAKESYRRGETVTLSAVGKPNTTYTLRICYKSGYSKAAGLGDAISDERGYVFWTFKIGNASSDDFIPYFELSGGGETIRHSFTIGEKSDKPLPHPQAGDTAPEKPADEISEGQKTAVTHISEKADTETPVDTRAQAAEPSTSAAAETKPPTEKHDVVPTETVPAFEETESAEIEFINLKAEYSLGETVTITIRGMPNTLYTLRLRLKSGYSTSKGLGEAKSDGSGFVSWTFRISPNADPTFEPWFEVEGGGKTVKKSFKLVDKKSYDDTTAAPKPEPANSPETVLADKPSVQEAVNNSEGSIAFIGIREDYRRGETVTVTIKGKPNTAYTLRVKYKSGYSSAKGLGETMSDENGVATWTFKIGNRVDTDFIPFFEVEGGGELAVLNFRVME